MTTKLDRKLAKGVTVRGARCSINTSHTKTEGTPDARKPPGTKVYGSQMASPISQKSGSGAHAARSGPEQSGSAGKVVGRKGS